MAGDWIKVRKSLPTDGRVVRISYALDADRLRTVGGLIAAWCLFDEHTEDGMLDGYTPKVFDEILGFPGLCKAMADVGWIVIHSQSLEAVNFTEHNGASARRRAQESARKNDEREVAKRPQNVRKTYASDADKKRTECGPEKRREEKSRGVDTKVSPPGVPLREDFSEAAQDAWKEWQDYRERRASAKGKDKLPWTEQAQNLSRKQIESHIESHGLQIVADRITAAIVGNWQGLNLDKLDAPAAPPPSETKPRYQPLMAKQVTWEEHMRLCWDRSEEELEAAIRGKKALDAKFNIGVNAP